MNYFMVLCCNASCIHFMSDWPIKVSRRGCRESGLFCFGLKQLESDMEHCQDLWLELIRDIIQLGNVEAGAAEPEKREEVVETFGQSDSRFRGSDPLAQGPRTQGLGRGTLFALN